MNLEQILSIICLFVLIIGLLTLLFIYAFLTYKDEKEYKQLRNAELKARIKFFQHYYDK